MKALAGVVAVASRLSLIAIVSCVPATFVAAATNVGGVMSGICATFADEAVIVLPTLSVTTS